MKGLFCVEMQSVRILDEKTIMSFALRSPNASFRSVPLTWRQNRTVFVTSGTFRFDRGSKRWPDVNLSRSLLPLRAVKSSKEPSSFSQINVGTKILQLLLRFRGFRSNTKRIFRFPENKFGISAKYSL